MKTMFVNFILNFLYARLQDLLKGDLDDKIMAWISKHITSKSERDIFEFVMNIIKMFVSVLEKVPATATTTTTEKTTETVTPVPAAVAGVVHVEREPLAKPKYND